MTEIEQKALALVNEVRAEWGGNWAPRTKPFSHEAFKALCRAIEQHEAFRQEVSDAAEHLCTYYGVQIVVDKLARFIIAKPDPLVDAVQDWWDADGYNDVANLRAAIEKRGGKIVWGEG